MKQYAVRNGGRGYSPYSISSSSMCKDYIGLFNVQLIVVERFEWYSKSISVCNIIYPSTGLQYLTHVPCFNHTTIAQLDITN